MRYNMNGLTITLSGTVMMFIGIVSAVVAQHFDEGNYIVPRATLVLGHKANRSAAGQKKMCQTNLDCQRFVNRQCCKTISGYSKCRKKCKKRGREKVPTNQETLTQERVPRIGGCIVDHNEIYKDGDIIKAKDGCNKCVCSKGKIICRKLPCPPAKCKYKNELYNDGYHLVLHNGCKRCVCKQKFWNCTIHPCDQDLKMRNSAPSVAAGLSILLAVIASTYLYAVT